MTQVICWTGSETQNEQVSPFCFLPLPLPSQLVNHQFPGEFWQILSLAADDVLDLFIQVETG